MKHSKPFSSGWRPCRASGLPGIAILFLCTFQAAFAQLPFFYDVTIHVSDGVDLEATIAEPLGLPPSGGFPGVVLVHGFGGSKEGMREISIFIAAYGYASLAYSVRGQGNSGGLSTVDGDRERLDLQEVIQFFRNAPLINPNRLGVAGGSQGGIHAWLAAVYRMQGVKAVAPALATPDFARALIPNGCVKFGLPRELTLSSVRYSSDRDRLRDFIVADQFDSIEAFIDARDLTRRIDSVLIPVYQALGWADFLFPVNGGIAAQAHLHARHVPVWSYFGTNGHGETIDPNEVAYALDKEVHWFDHWLKGFSLDGDTVPWVYYSDDRSGWPHHSTPVWPAEPYSRLRLYLTQGGLSMSPPPDSVVFPFSLDYDPAFTPRMGWDSLYGGRSFVNSMSSTSRRLVSDVLEEEAEVTGSPSGCLSVSSDAAKFQAHIRLYDVWASGTGYAWKLISRSINGVRQNVPGQVHQLIFEGTALSHFVPAGHRIGIEITSLDMLSDNQANTVPYFVSSHSCAFSTPFSPSYVDIPVVGGIVLAVGEARGVPENFCLQQNYPNPFNPSTTITYQLPTQSRVTLKVFDLLGREVARLVDGVEGAGNKSIRFDASALASGVYFYQLAAGGSVQARKMMLMK